MMYCIPFVEAFVCDRERELLAAATDARAPRKSTRRTARSAKRAQADTMARQLAEGEGRASVDQPCCPPVPA
jgi:hypothetical protein